MSEAKYVDVDQEPAQKSDVTDSRDTVLQEGIDYYLDKGLMVFTAAFLGRRGYCCERGCRHCPYGYSGSQNQER